MRISFACGALLLCTTAVSVHAEIGVPAGPGGFYVSLDGGYQYHHGQGVAAVGGQSGAPFPSVFGQSENSADAGCGGSFSAFGAGTSAGVNSPAASAICSNGSASATGSGFGAPAFANANATGPFGTVAASSDGGRSIAAHDGAFGSVSLGYVLPSSVFGSVSRIEAYATGDFADDRQTLSGAFGFRGVDNQSAFAAAGVGAVTPTGRVQQSVRMGELGLRFKADRQVGLWAAALSAEPFYASIQQSTSTDATLQDLSPLSASRASDVTGHLYGAQLAVEGVYPIAARFGLLGRASVGGYAFDSNGAFSSSIVAQGGMAMSDFHNGASGGGVRLGGQVGLRYDLAPGVWVSLLGGVDYFSAAPTAVLPTQASDRAAYVGIKNMTDYRVGLRVTGATFATPAL